MNYKILDSYLPESEKQYYESSNPGWEINTRNCLQMAPPQFMSFLMGLGLKQICVEIAVHIMSF